MPPLRRNVVDLAAVGVGAMSLWALFYACLELLQVRVASPPAFDLGPGHPFRSPEALLTERETATMVCVLVGGVVGGWLQFVRERFSSLVEQAAMRADDPPAFESAVGVLFAFVSQLFMGLAAAATIALMLPLALLSAPTLQPFNPWALLILAVVSGYQSRHFLGDIRARLEELLTRATEARSINPSEMASLLKTGIQEAFSPPPPVNFEGIVKLDIVDSEGASCVKRSEGLTWAVLTPGFSYVAWIEFRPLPLSSIEASVPWQPAMQPLRIEGGIDAVAIPFEVRLELPARAHSRPFDRDITVTRHEVGRISFDFMLPLAKAETSLERDEPGEMAIFVYQRSVFCAVATLPVHWATE